MESRKKGSCFFGIVFSVIFAIMAKKYPVNKKMKPSSGSPVWDTPDESPFKEFEGKKNTGPAVPLRPVLSSVSEYFPGYLLQMVILVITVFTFYGNTLGHKFALDDDVVILRNDHVQAGIKGIPDLLYRDSFHGYLKKNTDFLPGGRYRPLSLITFALEQEISKDNSYLGHAINVILFALTAVLMLMLLKKHLKVYPDLAFLAVFLFVIHPIHTEVVANIKSRDEILSLLFLLGTFYGLFEFLAAQKTQKKGYGWLAGALVSLFMALMAKENGVMMLFLLPMTLWVFSDLKLEKIVLWTLPFAAVIGVYLVIRQNVIGGLGVAYEDLMTNPYQIASNAQAFCTKVYVILKYLLLMVAPVSFSWDYSFNAVPYRDFSSVEFWAALLINGGLIGWALWKLKEKNVIAYGILFFYLSLALVSNFLINIGAPLGERFTYQGSAGFCLAVAAGMLFLIKKLSTQGLALRRGILFGVLGILTLTAGRITFARNADWYDSITIALKDVKTLPESAKTNMSAGDASMAQGAKADRDSIGLRVRCYQNAITYFNETLRITPDWKHAGKRMGEAYYELAQIADSLGIRGQEGLAQAVLKKAVPAKEMSFELLKTSVRWDTLRHNAWTNLGHMYTQRGNRPQALQCFTKAVNIMPDTFSYWYNVGAAHFELQTLAGQTPIAGMNHLDSAIKYFSQAIKLRPDWPDYLYDLGAVYYTAKRYDEAEKQFTAALKLNPQHPGANNGLNIVRQMKR